MLQASTQLTPQWNATPFYEMDVEAMIAIVTRWFKAAQRCERDLPVNEVSPKLKLAADTYRQALPIVTDLRNPKIQPRHWEKVEETLGNKVVRDEKLTLGALLDLRIVVHRDTLQQISTEATQESALEALLNKVRRTRDARARTHARTHPRTRRARTHPVSRRTTAGPDRVAHDRLCRAPVQGHARPVHPRRRRRHPPGMGSPRRRAMPPRRVLRALRTMLACMHGPVHARHAYSQQRMRAPARGIGRGFRRGSSSTTR
jgi:hypothetical protein